MDEPPALMTDADLEQGTVLITKRDKYPERHSHAHSDNFQSLTFPLLAPRNNHDKTCEPAKHFDPDQSYTEVFLSHTKLYVLGDFKLIDSLKALALFKLRKTLCVFQLNDGNAEDITVVLSFNDGFMDVLGDGGQLVKDFFRYEAQRIS